MVIHNQLIVQRVSSGNTKKAPCRDDREPILRELLCDLPHEGRPERVREAVGHHTVEIHTVGEAIGIPLYAVRGGTHVLIHQESDAAARHIQNLNRHMRGNRKLERDRRLARERVRVVLIQIESKAIAVTFIC